MFTELYQFKKWESLLVQAGFSVSSIPFELSARYGHVVRQQDLNTVNQQPMRPDDAPSER